jgi:platelet-activating factor acetylhydrolase
MIPIVFSHGLTAGRSMYSMHCCEMASHGYIVFALDHQDGSAAYTEDSKGKPIIFDTKAPHF